MGRRKFVLSEIEEWSSAEEEFVELCKSRNWIIENEEGTGVPILYPSHKNKRSIYKVGVHGRDGDNKVLMSLCITAKHGRTKKALLKKAEKADLQGELRIDCETDADYIFPIKRLARAVKTFNLRKKQKHAGPPKSVIAKGQAALRKKREEKL